MKHKPYVISIAAVSGGGKTAVAKHLAAKWNKGVQLIHFDDYELKGPHHFGEWAKNSGDYNDWDVLPIVVDICSSLENPAVEIIILDYPFSTLNTQLQHLIDLSIYIDTPLDIAMARRIVRDEFSSITEIRTNCQSYLNEGRRAYQGMVEKVKPSADIVIDGTLQLEEITARIFTNIKQERK
ncbi:uridine kinase [Niallia sp. FSL R7-0271]|uniref:uridine kinase n=1 Tax=Niallia sp. FSL R7-0271 TaxID=2921678 RepID=UPI0030FC0613